MWDLFSAPSSSWQTTLPTKGELKFLSALLSQDHNMERKYSLEPKSHSEHVATRETNESEHCWLRPRVTAYAAIPGVDKQSWVSLFSPQERHRHTPAELTTWGKDNVTAHRRL